MDFIVNFVKGMLAKEPARFASIASTAVVAGVLFLADKAGIHFSTEFILGLGGFIVLAAGELIRQLVFAPATTQAIANAATFEQPGTVVDIGSPPEGGAG